ncbi:hypothetical protein COHA_003760 [Chlorella ohadii]|uniref:U6 snRNA-associated Sm-like protein LSm4 n=1 Tax=Chlorella ohadii TaxID=2649997 RepID=A0AAD5DUT9_9CHLO|nr:hypothetical protein COHA_003760 [Chlorella ohadii]
MVQCDTWMNIHLREVICTSKDGDRFWRMPEAYIRGNTIKYLRVPDEVLDKAKEAEAQMKRDGAEMALCSFAAATGLSLGNAKEAEAQMKRDALLLPFEGCCWASPRGGLNRGCAWCWLLMFLGYIQWLLSK